MASLLSDTVRLDVPVHDRIDGETRYGTDIEFLHNVLAVGDDSCGADAQAVGNFFVGQSAHDEREHFDFTEKYLPHEGGSYFAGGVGHVRVRAVAVVAKHVPCCLRFGRYSMYGNVRFEGYRPSR